MYSVYQQEVQLDSGKSRIESSRHASGVSKNLYANRLSFIFDFKGPSFMVDTACSSSLLAFDIAVSDLRLGRCDMAIVATTQINLQPFTNFQAQHEKVNSSDGISKVWDKDADGFVRAETVECILLQKKSQAKRIYATVIHSKSNIDGYKKKGGFFPSKEAQQTLMEETYIEAGIDPNEIDYVEAHGTGTKVGDPEEAEALANAYCKNREGNLLIGLLKSNIGHGEGTSGLAAITKTIISFENKCIPANLNLKTIKPEIAKFCPPLQPVVQNTPFQPNYCGVNSFGLGGVNVHTILRANKKELTKESYLIANEIPRLVNYCGRTQESIDHMFDFIENNRSKVTRDFLGLLNDTVKSRPSFQSGGFPYRGSIIIKEKGFNDDGTIAYHYKRETSKIVGMARPIWFFFSGMGSQWTAMGKSLMVIDKFAQTIHKCDAILKQFQIHLLHILMSEDETSLDSIVNQFVAISAIQIALCEVLKELEIHPDGVIGHSFGEIACAYADKCLTLEQAMICAYWRGKVLEDSNIPEGKMVAVGLSWEEVIKRCPENVYAACDNAYDLVTISGLVDDTIKFMKKLESEGVFVREVAGQHLKPFHTNFIKPIANNLESRLKSVIPNPKLRSKRWISTSIPEKNWGDELAQYASAKYFVNNLAKPVLLTSSLNYIPKDAIVIEIAPHTLFASLFKRTLQSSNYVGLMKRNNNQHNIELFLNSMGQLYRLGVNPSIEKLYPKVEWPVARGTQSISSLIKWDHSESYFVRKYPQFFFPATLSDMTFEYSVDEPDDAYLLDHAIDGRVLFPATGYLMVAWRRLAAQKGQQWNKIPVVFENVHFKRAVMFEKGKIKLTVRYTEPTGEFVVLDGPNVAATGKVFAVNHDEALQLQHLNEDISKINNQYTLNTEEFYKELKVRGYDYGPKFQDVVESKFVDATKSFGKVRWTNTSNFIAFLDATLQLFISTSETRSLDIPVTLQSFRCNPVMLFDAIDSHKRYLDEKSEENHLDAEKKIIFGNDESVEMYKEELNDIENLNEKFGVGNQKWVSDVPMIVNNNLNAIITKGLEVKGMISVMMPRKFLSKDLRLERYQFIPFYENDAIENYYRNELTTYLNVCSAICKQILEKSGINIQIDGLMKNLNNLKVEQKLIDELLLNISEEHTLFNALNLLAAQKDLNKNFFVENEIINDLRQKLEFDISKDIINLAGRNERLIRPMLDTINENVTPIKQLNVLEMNITNGIMGPDISQMQIETFIVAISVGYTIAHNNLERVKEMKDLEKIGRHNIIKWDYQTNNFPEDIKEQFNLIIHRDSFELWTIDLNEYLKSASKVLKDNGFVLAVFRSKLTTPEIILNELLRNKRYPSEKELSNRIEIFSKVAIENGFRMVSKKTDSMLFTLVLLRKFDKKIEPNKQTVFEVKTRKYEEWLEPMKELIKDHKLKGENNIWLIANDTSINGIIGLVQCLRQESGGEYLRYIFDIDNKLPKKIDFNISPFKEMLESDLVMNVFKDNNWGSMKHLSIPKNDDQIQTTEAYANVLQKGDLSSLQWFDGRKLYNPFTFIPLKEIQQKDVDIYYSALNFKDIMLATGRISAGPQEPLIDCFLGLEFAGRRRDNGERVFGMSCCFGIATQAKTHEPYLFKIPDHWSMEEAATVCSVYMTCWYGLIERGKLEEGESILIHSGTGGIGQAAINICQYYKCKIFTTVSTQEKRDFLKKNFGLVDDQIFSSRDTDFEQKILTATKGDGVNLVLNSLAEDKLLASFRCLGDDGRFIEIGKYDFQMNNPLPMFAFLKNISFHGVAMDKGSYLDKVFHLKIVKQFEAWMYDGIKKGFVKPFHRTVFRSNEIKEAFKYMMTGKHIGKVLIKIRDEESERKPLKASPIKMIATTKTWFDPEKVYIIIGGLGGMGIEIVYWMMLRGAKKVVLTSRSGIKTNPQRLFFRHLEDIGKRTEAYRIQVKIMNENVVDEQNARNVIQQAESMGKIGGIFNLAMVLHDALFENQTIEAFYSVCGPKVDATINLDKLSRQLPYQLDYFVTFSSIASGRGNTGQSNYAYANSVMERICEERRRDGLHGLSIQWGPIGDVGVLINTFDDEKIKMAGIILQRLPSWLYVLDKYLQCPYPVVASAIRMDKQFKSESAEENVMKQLWASLGIDPKTLPNNIELGEIGMESFVALELQQRLERDYDISLTLNGMKRITIGELRDFGAGNVEKLKEYAADLTTVRESLSKIKFELTDEPVTKLNDVTSGKPIYLLPPIESLYADLIPLAKLLPFPVYGLNWTYEMEELTSIKEIALHYTNLMKMLEPKGDYNLLTTTFGSVIALRMAYKKAPIKRIFIVDTFSYGQAALGSNEQSSDSLDQILRFMNRNVPKTFQDRFKNDLFKAQSEEDKVNNLIQSLKELIPSSTSKDFELILKGTLKKAKMIKEFVEKYAKKYQKANDNILTHKLAKDKLKRRIKSDMIIIKPSNTLEDQREIEEKMFQELGLNKDVSLHVKSKYSFNNKY